MFGCLGKFSVTEAKRPKGSEYVVAIADAHLPTTTSNMPPGLYAVL